MLKIQNRCGLIPACNKTQIFRKFHIHTHTILNLKRIHRLTKYFKTSLLNVPRQIPIHPLKWNKIF